jgi:hypothetical protein
MSEKRFEAFEEFWPFYVHEHAKKSTRVLHFIGTTGAMALAAYGAVTRKPWALLAAPISGYGFAWFSHFFIEKNRPATFKYPAWSLKADFVMWSKMVRGEMDAEVERVMRDYEEARQREAAAADATPATNAPGAQASALS